MLNFYTVVGRITEIKEKSIIIAVPRSYKNTDGIYETDFFEIMLFENAMNNTKEYCKKGDLMGIKGHLQTDEKGNIKIIAEKVTLLSSKEEN